MGWGFRTAAAVLVVGACGGKVLVEPGGGPVGRIEDAGSASARGEDASGAPSDAPFEAGPPCDPDAPFGAPEPIPELDLSYDNFCARLSPDERSVIFTRMYSSVEIWTGVRASKVAPFGNFKELDTVALDVSYGEFSCASLTGDGTTMYFAYAPDGPVGGDIYVARKEQGRFSKATAIDAVNTPRQQGWPYVLPDGSALYFHSELPSDAGPYDDQAFRIFRAAVTNGVVQPPAMIDVGGPASSPVVTPDELTLYFIMTGPRGSGTWMARRKTTSEPFGPPLEVVPAIGGGFFAPSFVTPDDCTLYGDGPAPPGSPHERAIYRVRRAR